MCNFLVWGRGIRSNSCILLDRHYILQEDTHLGEKPENVKNGGSGTAKKMEALGKCGIFQRRRGDCETKWQNKRR